MLRPPRTRETGQAYILLQASGQNSIIIQHGANFELTPVDVQRATGLIQSADFVVAELETPVAATAEAHSKLPKLREWVPS